MKKSKKDLTLWVRKSIEKRTENEVDVAYTDFSFFLTIHEVTGDNCERIKKRQIFGRVGKMKKILLYLLMALCVFALLACGKKGVDTSKAISEVKAEAEKMDVSQLRQMALKYKDAILEKTKEVEQLMAKIKPTDILSAEAKKIKAEVDDLNKSVGALKERFNVYYDKLKAKDGDVSGLDL